LTFAHMCNTQEEDSFLPHPLLLVGFSNSSVAMHLWYCWHGCNWEALLWKPSLQRIFIKFQDSWPLLILENFQWSTYQFSWILV